MNDECDFETQDDNTRAFEPKKLDEKDFSKRLNQQKLSKFEMDEMFLTE